MEVIRAPTTESYCRNQIRQWYVKHLEQYLTYIRGSISVRCYWYLIALIYAIKMERLLFFFKSVASSSTTCPVTEPRNNASGSSYFTRPHHSSPAPSPCPLNSDQLKYKGVVEEWGRCGPNRLTSLISANSCCWPRCHCLNYPRC